MLLKDGQWGNSAINLIFFTQIMHVCTSVFRCFLSRELAKENISYKMHLII